MVQRDETYDVAPGSAWHRCGSDYLAPVWVFLRGSGVVFRRIIAVHPVVFSSEG
jgi:hypothetical protein